MLVNDKTFKKYKKLLERLTVEQDNEINRELIDLNGEVYDIVGSSEGVPSENRILTPLTVIIVSFFELYKRLLVDYNEKAVDLNGTFAREIISVYKNNVNINPQEIIDRIPEVKYKLGTKVLTKVFPVDGSNVGKRIRTLQGSTLNTVRNIIADSINKGLSAKQLASEITNIIKKDERKLWTSPFEYYRNRFGILEKVQPSTIKAGSVDFNAIRIARTEINNTYREATYLLHKGQPYMDGWEWRLSNSHSLPDICDDLAKGSPYKVPPHTPHPYCTCQVLPKLIDPNKL